MAEKIKELIIGYKAQKEVIDKLINHEETEESEKDNLLVVRRFLSAFILDLEKAESEIS